VKPRFDRLEHLAHILDTADAEHRKNGEPTYSQWCQFHLCGTPSCALGHYRARTERARSLAFYEEKEFGLSQAETEELFDCDGCGGAKTAKQAAKYIRKFIARKRRSYERAARSAAYVTMADQLLRLLRAAKPVRA
jgi:hypothetical protein